MINFIVTWVVVAVSLLAFYLLQGAFPPPWSHLLWAFPVLAGWAIYDWFFRLVHKLAHRKPPVVTLAGINWTLEDFVRGWLITGKTGSGKTQAAINTLTFQLFQNVPGFGALCLDQKGLYWEILVQMAAHFNRSDDLTLLQVRPVNAPTDWKPTHTINLTGDKNVPAATYAKTIVDTGKSLAGGKGGNPFFDTKAQLGIKTAFDVLRHLHYACTIPNAYYLLLNRADADEAIQKLSERKDAKSGELLIELRDNYYGQPPEQLGGVQGTIHNYLAYFLEPDIAEVFCNTKPTFNIEQIDQGKIVCIAMPQKYQSERLYVNTIMKLAYYFHALCRFDRTAAERADDNLLVLFADEGQEIITGAESAFADHRVAGVIREARATIVLATQAYTSILSSLEERYAKTLFVNMANQIIFQVADQESAERASKTIGSAEKVERTWGTSGGRSNYNYSNKVKAFIEPHVLRNDFKKFEAVILHCEGDYKRAILPPRTPAGEIPDWFLQE